MNVCAICGEQSQLVYESLVGYQQGIHYDIYFCGNCDASYADPLEVDENLYNIIYSKAKTLPGYDRYYRFAKDVLKVKNPLQYLAETEDTYWAIYDYVINQKITHNPSILEVGCGLGYLTYALAKSGYKSKGIDISKGAIESANSKYGNYYVCADVHTHASTSNEKFDIIILTEVIEHIPDPLGFVESLRALMSTEGRILITTPNKDKLISDELYWDTELPPVHLWWLSKKSFENIGDKLKLKLSFTDFTNFQKNAQSKRIYNSAWRKQTLGADGSILFTTRNNSLRYIIRRNLISYNMLNKWQNIKKMIGIPIVRENPSISDRLCAIFSKGDEHE